VPDNQIATLIGLPRVIVEAYTFEESEVGFSRKLYCSTTEGLPAGRYGLVFVLKLGAPEIELLAYTKCVAVESSVAVIDYICNPFSLWAEGFAKGHRGSVVLRVELRSLEV